MVFVRQLTPEMFIISVIQLSSDGAITEERDNVA